MKRFICTMPCPAPTAAAPVHTLSASYYADHAVWCSAEITSHAQIARDTFRLRFRAPPIAERIAPGQFLMLRLAGFDDPLLGRALALFDIASNAAGEPTDVEVVYMVVGKMTRRLTAFRPGQKLEAWGPLGNGFPLVDTNHLIMVAGGVGITPFLAVAKKYREIGGSRFEVGNLKPSLKNESAIANLQPSTSNCRLTLCYGARSAEYFAALDEFAAVGVDVQLSTDDGSRGHHGRVTELLAKVLGEANAEPPNPEPQIPTTSPILEPRTSNLQPLVYCCGPEPMMEAAAKVCADAGVPCYVSLETPMACGVGICFTCVAKVRQSDGEWDYKRTCVEGPVFEARRIVWH